MTSSFYVASSQETWHDIGAFLSSLSVSVCTYKEIYGISVLKIYHRDFFHAYSRYELNKTRNNVW